MLAPAWDRQIDEAMNKLPLIRNRYPRSGSSSSKFVVREGQSYHNFISNDYLGLSTHPQLKQAFKIACDDYGVGSTGAASLSGYTEAQYTLEQSLAQWLQLEDVLVMNSGFSLNNSLYKSLSNTNVMIWLDRNCHASHIDGVLACKSRFARFDGSNMADLRGKISRLPGLLHLVISEGVFSMDGSSHYLAELIRLRKNFGEQMLLIIDDAHGVGTIGEIGFGQIEATNFLVKDIDLYIGTLGKTFASHGAFAGGNRQIIDYLRQSIRAQIYTTCLPPAIHAASNAALDIIRSEEGLKLRQQLQANIDIFKAQAKNLNLQLMYRDINHSPIQLISGYPLEQLSYLANYLQDKRILAGFIRYPTVAKNNPRIRLSLLATHDADDISKLCYEIQQGLSYAS